MKLIIVSTPIFIPSRRAVPVAHGPRLQLSIVVVRAALDKLQHET